MGQVCRSDRRCMGLQVEVVDGGCGELGLEGLGGLEAGFELVAEGHEGVYLGHNAVLFFEGREGYGYFAYCFLRHIPHGVACAGRVFGVVFARYVAKIGNIDKTWIYRGNKNNAKGFVAQH